jgi:dihydroorotate dehydrogenase
MYRLVRPILFSLPPEAAHKVAFAGLRLSRPLLPLAAPFFCLRHPSLERELLGLKFPNPVGLAAGMDKEAALAWAWPRLGFGFMELGTLTPRPQPGNPKPRIFRFPQSQALVNRMGFNNGGVQAAAGRLRGLKLSGRWPASPVGVSIGKNKTTPNEDAAQDYLACVAALQGLADYLAVNISSPKTPGLRLLQRPKALKALLRQVCRAAGATPVLVKLAPDLPAAALARSADLALEAGCRGLILTNTTLSRQELPEAEAVEGGMSGRPLFQASTRLLALVAKRLNGKAALIASGGVFDAQDARAKLEAGADLVQVYTGFIYQGPAIARAICAGLLEKGISAR